MPDWKVSDMEINGKQIKLISQKSKHGTVYRIHLTSGNSYIQIYWGRKDLITNAAKNLMLNNSD